MVKLVSLAVAAASVVFLLAGYLASQYAAMHGSAEAYAEKMDSPPIRLLALVILGGSIAYALFQKGEDPV